MRASTAECFAMKTVGEQAKEFRLAKGWTATRMAKEVKTSRQNIEHLEARGGITPKYIAGLARVMGKSVDALLGHSVDAQTLSPPLLQNQSQFFSPTVTVDPAPQLSALALELAERFDRLTVKETRLEALNACLALLEARAEQAMPKALKQSNGAGV